MSTLTVERSATAELALTVSQNGGVSGLAAVVAVRDGSSYLDWFDMTFKVSGWTTRQAAMIEIGDGHYRHSLDLAAITNLPSATVALSAEYATTGAVAASAHDLLLLVASFLDLPTAAAVASVQADADDIQTRLPAALVSGRLDASVGAMAAGVLTASSLAADAVAEVADAIWDEAKAGHIAAGSFGEEVQGHATQAEILSDATPFAGASIAAILADTDSLDATKITTARANALDEITVARLGELDAANLPADIAAVQADVDDIQTRLPATLVGGRIDASVGAMAAGVVTASAIATNALDADALATDAVAEIVAATDTQLSSTHGAGSWDATATVPPQTIRDAMKLAPSAGDPDSGSVDEMLVRAELASEIVQDAILLANLTAQSGATVAYVPTGSTAADGFYDGMTVVVRGSFGAVARTALSYASGAFTLHPNLPSAPVLGDSVYVLGVLGEAAISSSPSMAVQLAEIHRLMGLDENAPLYVSKDSQMAGTLKLTQSEVGSSIVVQRIT